MSHKAVQIVFLLFIASAPLCASPAWHSEKAKIIRNVIVKYYPDALIVQDNGHLRAKYNTMDFTIHRKFKNGKVLIKTDVVEGPNFNGFMLEFSIIGGKYIGPMIVPQILNRPYWETYVDRPMTEDGKAHYNVTFSYGSRLNSNFKKAVLKVLPKSRALNNRSSAR